jgi:protein CpxP
MKLHLRKHLVTCALLAGTGLAAYAQTAPTAPAGPQGQHQRFDPAKRAEFMARRMADLKQKLQIQPNQESAWTTFTNAMRPSGNMQRPDRQALANMSTPDRIDQMRALRNQRNAEMDRRAEATKAFYAQLTSEQKKTFDAETARMFSRRGGHRHHQG